LQEVYFRQVTGLDASSLYSFQKLFKVAQQYDCQVLLSALSPSIAANFDRHKLTVNIYNLKNKETNQSSKVLQSLISPEDNSKFNASEHSYRFIISPTLDIALQWCEESILAKRWRRTQQLPMALQLAALFNNDEVIPVFLNYLVRQSLEQSTHLFKEGQMADALYFLEHGMVSTYRGDLEQVPTVDGQPVWIESLGASTLLGEVDFLAQNHYSVSAWVTQPGMVLCLTRDRLTEMEHCDPAVALAFAKYLNGYLAQKFNQSLIELNALLT
jgi:hypothetical protein